MEDRMVWLIGTDTAARRTGPPRRRGVRAPGRLTWLALLLLVWPTVGAQAGIGEWTTGGPGVVTVQAIVVDTANPGTVYAGAVGFGVFKSVNGGAEWNAAAEGMTDKNVRALVIDPADPATLYAGTSAFGGVFKSVNAAGSWDEVNTGLTNSQVQALAIGPGRLYAGTPSGVFTTVNGGGDWDGPLTNGFIGIDTNVQALAAEPGAPSTVYAGTLNSGVYRSTNGADQWTPVVNGLTNLEIRALAMNPVNPATLYAGTAGGVFKTTNSGGQWNPANSGLTSLDVRALAVNPATPATVYAATGGGVFRSLDAGASWAPLNNGLPSLDVRAAAVDPLTATAHVGLNQKGVFEFQDAGLPLAVAVTGPGSVSSAPAGIDCGTECSQAYALGTVVTLTPVPGATGVFDGFGGDADCLDGVVTLLQASVACTAHFSRPVTLSPGSTVLLPEQSFDFVVVTRPGARTATSLGVAVNGSDVTAPFQACQVPGTLPGGAGTTARCGGLTGGLLRDLFGPGPFTVEVTTAFDDGASVTETATWTLATSLPGSGLVLSPSADILLTSQGFDFVLVVGPEGADLASGQARLDGIDVTAALVDCVIPGGLAGGGLTFRCPGLTGGVLGPGPHTVEVTLTLGDGSTLPATITWEVLAPTEP
jgi:hypothetical protein